jgi:putative membrane protein
MPAAIDSLLQAWSLPLPVTLALVFTALVYLRGWVHLQIAFPNMIPMWRVAAFLSGLFSVWIAIGSPIAVMDHELLSIHMAQHLLLMTVGPPLILLGAPALPLMHGFPKVFIRRALGCLLRLPLAQGFGQVLSHPVFCWFSAAIVLIGWHIPSVYALGLDSEWWHHAEHACFFVAGFLFWWPVIPSWSGVSPRPRWSTVLYLFLATLPCDALSAYLAFCDRVVYRFYLVAPRHFSISALQDQGCAGALMWVCVTFAYLFPAVVITMRLLSTPCTVEQGVRQGNFSEVAVHRLIPSGAGEAGGLETSLREGLKPSRSNAATSRQAPGR